MNRASAAPSWLMPLVALGSLAWILHAWLPAAGMLSQAAADRQDLLRGTWLREYSEDGVQVRRVLDLERDGAFHESVRIADADGHITRMEHAGHWFYDGTNLKRNYTLMNGQPPSRLRVPFATFEVDFQGSNEFVGVDHVHGVRIEYRRVADDTLP